MKLDSWLKRNKDHPDQRRRPIIGAALVTLCSFALLLAGFLWSAPVGAQEPSPIVITKRASVEEAQVDDIIGYEIEIANNGRTDSGPLQATDPLPEDVAFVDNSLQFDKGQAAFDAATRTVRWGGALKANEKVLIKFNVRVLPINDVAKCAALIINQAMVEVVQPTANAVAIDPAVVQVKRLCPDAAILN